MFVIGPAHDRTHRICFVDALGDFEIRLWHNTDCIVTAIIFDAFTVIVTVWKCPSTGIGALVNKLAPLNHVLQQFECALASFGWSEMHAPLQMQETKRNSKLFEWNRKRETDFKSIRLNEHDNGVGSYSAHKRNTDRRLAHATKRTCALTVNEWATCSVLREAYTHAQRANSVWRIQQSNSRWRMECRTTETQLRSRLRFHFSVAIEAQTETVVFIIELHRHLVFFFFCHNKNCPNIFFFLFYVILFSFHFSV